MANSEKGRIVGILGLDGVGKSTAAKGLADHMGARYMRWQDGADGADITSIQDLPVALQFRAYLTVTIEAHRRAQEHAENGEDIIFDGPVIKLMANYRAAGLPEEMLGQVPAWTIDQIDLYLLLTLPEAERQTRFQQRVAQGEGLSGPDRRSLEMPNEIDQWHRQFVGDNPLIEVDIAGLSREETVEVLWQTLS